MWSTKFGRTVSENESGNMLTCRIFQSLSFAHVQYESPRNSRKEHFPTLSGLRLFLLEHLLALVSPKTHTMKRLLQLERVPSALKESEILASVLGNPSPCHRGLCPYELVVSCMGDGKGGWEWELTRDSL